MTRIENGRRIDITTGRPYRYAIEECIDHDFSEIGTCIRCGYRAYSD